VKCHIGVGARSGLVHTIEFTAANEHNITIASKLIREDDEVVYGDSGYLGLQKRKEIQADPHLASIDYRINRRPKSLPKVSEYYQSHHSPRCTVTPDCRTRCFLDKD